MCVSASISLASSSSRAASTVTVWATFQFEVVNLSDSLFSDRSVPEWPEIDTVTVSIGFFSSATV